jgi:hypothetical protein
MPGKCPLSTHRNTAPQASETPQHWPPNSHISNDFTVVLGPLPGLFHRNTAPQATETPKHRPPHRSLPSSPKHRAAQPQPKHRNTGFFFASWRKKILPPPLRACFLPTKPVAKQATDDCNTASHSTAKPQETDQIPDLNNPTPTPNQIP